MTELENVKNMNERKGTDESGLIAEYLKALGPSVLKASALPIELTWQTVWIEGLSSNSSYYKCDL